MPPEFASFPAAAVRDLLGIVRGLYGAAQHAGAGPVELQRIASVGQELGRALALASRSSPGSLGHTAAFRRAEDATARLGDLVDALTPAEPLVTAARARVSGARVALRTKRPVR